MSDPQSEELDEAVKNFVEDLKKRFSALTIMIHKEEGIAELHKYNRLIAIQIFERGRTINVK